MPDDGLDNQKRSLLGNPLMRMVILIGACVAMYWPTLQGGFIIDDADYVTADERLTSVEGLREIWMQPVGESYRHQHYPMTSTAFWAQHQVWGNEAKWYHAVNIALHALNALLLWTLLARLRVPGAWVAGLLFALHPVHVASVAWVSELKNVLSTLFFLLATITLIPALAVPRPSVRIFASPVRIVLYSIGLALFAAALLAKTATALLPVGLGLILWWKVSLTRGRVLALVPLVLMGGAAVYWTTLLESQHAAIGEPMDVSMRWLIAGRAVCFYLQNFGWPIELSFVYPHFDLDPAVWTDHLWSAGVVAGLILLWLGSRWIGRGPVAAMLFFVAAIVPMSLIDVGYHRFSWVADHWSYWASMSVFALVCAIGTTFWWEKARTLLRAPAFLVAAMAIGMVGSIGYLRATTFQDPQKLWIATLRVNPDSWLAHSELARVYSLRGDLATAIPHAEQAVEIRRGDAKLLNNLATLLQSQGRKGEAIDRYRAALAFDGGDALAHTNLATLLIQQGHVEEAIEHFERAVALDGRSAVARSNYGGALISQQRFGEAIEQLHEAVRLDPLLDDGWFNLATTHRHLRRYDDAIVSYRRVLDLHPGHLQAMRGLGKSLLARERFDEAHAALTRVTMTTDIDPRDWRLLGRIELARGEPLRAIHALRRALALDTWSTATRRLLVDAYLEVGDTNAAIVQLRAAIETSPRAMDLPIELALLLATHPGAREEHIIESIALAEGVAQASRRLDDRYMSVLALTYASSGQFDRAIETIWEASLIVDDRGIAEVPDP